MRSGCEKTVERRSTDELHSQGALVLWLDFEKGNTWGG